MRRVLILLLITFFGASFLFAQVDREKALKPKVELKLADLLYAQGHYYSAAEYYKEYVRVKPNDRYGKYWLAMAYLKASDYANAAQWFENFSKTTPGPKVKTKRWEKETKEVYELADYYYGVSLKHVERYENAIKRLSKFKSSYEPKEGKKKKGNEEKDNWRLRANTEIIGAQMGTLDLPTKKITINSIGDEVNSSYEEAAPVFVNDTTIYYSSLNEDQLLFVDRAKEIPPYRLYQAKKVDGEWKKGKRLPSVLNDEKFGTGNAAISEDGNRMYFCKCLNTEIDEIICNLYFTKKKGTRWSEPEKLNSQINSPKYTSTQPAVRTSGDNMDIVYFVSDREGGKGGMDIWYFIRTARGDFKGPRLLGGKINTPFDELTPFYDNTENLFYFSSNGHPSYGGFDVFVSKEDEELGWIDPSNIGKPANSPADDLYFIKEYGKTSGFMVSNREGTTKIKNRYRGDDIFYYQDMNFGLGGFVFKEDKNGTSPLLGATIKLYTDDAYGNEVLVSTLDNIEDEYYFDLKPDKEYKLEVSKTGFASKFDYVSTIALTESDTINKNLTVNKTSFIAGGQVFDDKDTDKTKGLTGAIVSIAEIMPDGSKRPITAKRITDKNPAFYFQLDSDKDYEFDVVKEGFFKNKIEVTTKGVSNDVDTINTDLFMSMIEAGKSYELENILYDFGKADLRSESEVVLDDLVEILQENPAIIIELGAHTDAIGSDAANLKLSQARAQSCVDYLASKGISKDRMFAKGYGESVPIAPNENEDGSDNEEGRQKNRRTEFKVVGGF